ncbi:MAG: hypothetical protein ACLSS9_10915 [Acutalibacteraceae bacterium]
MNEKDRADIIELLWYQNGGGVCREKLLEADNHPEYRATAIDLLMLIGSTCGVEAERLEKR